MNGLISITHWPTPYRPPAVVSRKKGFDMNECEFWELEHKKDRAQKCAQLHSNFLLGSSALGLLCWVVGFFLFNRQPVWFFFCLVFIVISFALGCAVICFRKTAKKIETKIKFVSGGSGAGRSRYWVTPSILRVGEETKDSQGD